MASLKSVWKPVSRRDYYVQAGDTHFVNTRRYVYYWNPQRMVTRRYADDHYCEVGHVRQPDASRLPTLYCLARKQDRLQAFDHYDKRDD